MPAVNSLWEELLSSSEAWDKYLCKTIISPEKINLRALRIYHEARGMSSKVCQLLQTETLSRILNRVKFNFPLKLSRSQSTVQSEGRLGTSGVGVEKFDDKTTDFCLPGVRSSSLLVNIGLLVRGVTVWKHCPILNTSGVHTVLGFSLQYQLQQFPKLSRAKIL